MIRRVIDRISSLSTREEVAFHAGKRSILRIFTPEEGGKKWVSIETRPLPPLTVAFFDPSQGDGIVVSARDGGRVEGVSLTPCGAGVLSRLMYEKRLWSLFIESQLDWLLKAIEEDEVLLVGEFTEAWEVPGLGEASSGGTLRLRNEWGYFPHFDYEDSDE